MEHRINFNCSPLVLHMLERTSNDEPGENCVHLLGLVIYGRETVLSQQCSTGSDLEQSSGHTIDDYLGCEAVQGREFACKDWRTCIYSKLISSRCHFHSTRSLASRFNIQSGHGPPPGSWQLFAVCLHRRTFDRGARPSYMQPT